MNCNKKLLQFDKKIKNDLNQVTYINNTLMFKLVSELDNNKQIIIILRDWVKVSLVDVVSTK